MGFAKQAWKRSSGEYKLALQPRPINPPAARIMVEHVWQDPILHGCCFAISDPISASELLAAPRLRPHVEPRDPSLARSPSWPDESRRQVAQMQSWG